MKRVGRYMWNALTAVAILLLLVGLWLLTDAEDNAIGEKNELLIFAEGRRVVFNWYGPVRGKGGEIELRGVALRAGKPWHPWLNPAFTPRQEYRIEISIIWLFILSAARPLYGLLRAHFRKPRYLFACTQCGYDLRASPDRCPECGTEVKKNEPQMNADQRG